MKAIKFAAAISLIVFEPQVNALKLTQNSKTKDGPDNESSLAMIVNATVQDSISKQQDAIVNEAIEEFHKSQNQISTVSDSLSLNLMPTISHLQK